MEVLAGVAIIGLIGMVALLIVMKDRSDKRYIQTMEAFTDAIDKNTQVIQDLRAAIIAEDNNHKLVIQYLSDLKGKV